jgi:hypothetical protein
MGPKASSDKKGDGSLVPPSNRSSPKPAATKMPAPAPAVNAWAKKAGSQAVVQTSKQTEVTDASKGQAKPSLNKSVPAAAKITANTPTVNDSPKKPSTSKSESVSKTERPKSSGLKVEQSVSGKCKY